MPKIGLTIAGIMYTNLEIAVSTQSGTVRVETLAANAGHCILSSCAISGMEICPSAVAMKRCPLAAGAVMASTCSSATSRTSTRACYALLACLASIMQAKTTKWSCCKVLLNHS